MKKYEVSGTGSKEALSGDLHSIFSDFTKELADGEERYSFDYADAVMSVKDVWPLHDKMKGYWEDYCGSSLAYTFGSRTAEYSEYLKRDSGGLLNSVLDLFSKNPRPDVTHDMLESDWDRLFEDVLIPGNDYIEELANSRPYISNAYGSGYNYQILINKMVHSLVDGANLDKIEGAQRYRQLFVELLEKVDAVELSEVRLDDSSLKLIHDVKTYF